LLSTAESELVALFEPTCFVKSIRYLLDKIKAGGLSFSYKNATALERLRLLFLANPKSQCDIFEGGILVHKSG
jgi:hypothetical protein